VATVNGRTTSKSGSASVALLWVCGLLLCLAAVIVGVIAYLVHRGADYRAPRVLPNGYTVARYTHQGAQGWGMTAPNNPYASVPMVDADGKEILGNSWEVTRLAISGDVVVTIGEASLSLRQYVDVAFELNTRTGKMTLLSSVVAAEQRVEELKLSPTGGGWVDIDALPRAPKAK
jgi:hypothetical protein